MTVKELKKYLELADDENIIRCRTYVTNSPMGDYIGETDVQSVEMSATAFIIWQEEFGM